MAFIVAIGTANPPYKNQQQKAAALVSNALKLSPAKQRMLKAVYQATGIEYRYSVVSDFCNETGDFTFIPTDPQGSFPSTRERMKIYEANACQLAKQAVENCLKLITDFDKAHITHLITVSCTGMYAPGIDIQLIETLHLNSHVERTAVNFMGCYGVFNALKLARAICNSNKTARVLVVSVELCTIHFQKDFNKDNLISNAIFSDGAGAILVQADSDYATALKIENTHCDLLPQSHREMSWHIGDSGFDIGLSAYVADIIKKGIKHFVQKLLDVNQLLLTNIDYYAIHPGGIKILKACEEALALTPNDNRYSYQVLKNFGNMSSATVLFILKAIWHELDQAANQKRIFSCAFGPGLTVEAMLLKIICRS